MNWSGMSRIAFGAASRLYPLVLPSRLVPTDRPRLARRMPVQPTTMPLERSKNSRVLRFEVYSGACARFLNRNKGSKSFKESVFKPNILSNSDQHKDASPVCQLFRSSDLAPWPQWQEKCSHVRLFDAGPKAPHDSGGFLRNEQHGPACSSRAEVGGSRAEERAQGVMPLSSTQLFLNNYKRQAK